jgi:hypothetical protein
VNCTKGGLIPLRFKLFHTTEGVIPNSYSETNIKNHAMMQQQQNRKL